MADQISIVTDQPTTDSGSPITAAVNFRTRSTSSASVPSSIRYRVDCLTTKRNVINWTSVAAANSATITVPGTLNGIVDDGNDFETRQILIEIDSGLTTQAKNASTWRVKNSRIFEPVANFDDDLQLEPFYPEDAVESAETVQRYQYPPGHRFRYLSSFDVLDAHYYRITDAELSAGVAIVNYQFPTGDVPRYITNTTPGTTDAFAGIDAAIDSANVDPGGNGANSPIKLPTGQWASSDSIIVPAGVSLFGEGERSTELIPLGVMGGAPFVRLGNLVDPLFGTKLSGVLIQCGGGVSTGVQSNDIQSGGCFDVTVNNFVDYGFRIDGTGGALGSVNGYSIYQCQAFKVNLGGTSGIAYSAKSGSFFPMYQLAQATGNENNPLAAAFYFENIPSVMLACNSDGTVGGGAGLGVATGIDYNANVPCAFLAGFTALQNTTAVNISTTGSITINALYTANCTYAVLDAGNGGGVAKTITDVIVPLLVRGQYPAHFDFAKVWGGIEWNKSATSPATATNGTISTALTPLSRVTPAGNITGVILQAGTRAGQHVVVINKSAFTITFDVAGTSKVADGTGCVIAALRGAQFVWDDSASLWYRTD